MHTHYSSLNVYKILFILVNGSVIVWQLFPYSLSQSMYPWIWIWFFLHLFQPGYIIPPLRYYCWLHIRWHILKILLGHSLTNQNQGIRSKITFCFFCFGESSFSFSLSVSPSSWFDFLFRLCDGGISRSSGERGDFAFVRLADLGRDSWDLGRTSGFWSFDG